MPEQRPAVLADYFEDLMHQRYPELQGAPLSERPTHEYDHETLAAPLR